MEKPILFNTEMVQAILEGRKTQTRRITTFKPYTSLNETNGDFEICEPVTQNFFRCRLDFEKWAIKKCKYKVGDILYVRETWMIQSMRNFDKRVKFLYKAEPNEKLNEVILTDQRYEDLIKYSCKNGWQPSLFMPKEAARIFLKVTNIRAERLQDITEDGAKAEGTIYPIVDTGNNVLKDGYRLRFSDIWNSIYKNWDENPWVWVIEFEKINSYKI